MERRARAPPLARNSGAAAHPRLAQVDTRAAASNQPMRWGKITQASSSRPAGARGGTRRGVEAGVGADGWCDAVHFFAERARADLGRRRSDSVRGKGMCGGAVARLRLTPAVSTWLVHGVGGANREEPTPGCEWGRQFTPTFARAQDGEQGGGCVYIL